MTGDKTAESTDLQETDPTTTAAATPAPQQAPSGWAPLLWILGGLVLVALPFGAVAILAVAVSGMFLGKEVMEAPAIPLMLACSWPADPRWVRACGRHCAGAPPPPRSAP